MVQKSKPRRGRPRAYDPEIALTRAMNAFWKYGYNGASLDELSQAMGMNRPSVYAAFRDKLGLYRKALDHYRAQSRAEMAEALSEDRPLREALRDFYERAIAIYLSGEDGQRGCFMIGTTLTEAVANPELRATLGQSLRGLDAFLAARIAVGQKRNEVDVHADPVELGRIGSAMLYLLAIQARAGEPRKTLTATMHAALAAICKPPIEQRRKKDG
jgi:TetR/AcrR family transcriptional regulator, copper-responsive repressor